MGKFQLPPGLITFPIQIKYVNFKSVLGQCGLHYTTPPLLFPLFHQSKPTQRERTLELLKNEECFIEIIPGNHAYWRCNASTSSEIFKIRRLR